jgi:acyl carrier protein phosphodiesterase
MMNFLSHYYFEQRNSTENVILGVVLPDFIKNADKTCNLHPLKEKHNFFNNKRQLEILRGWERHLIVDNIFHNSVFFKQETKAINHIITPILKNSAGKPFFLAHIGLELMLDHLLYVNEKISIENFYKALNNADKVALENILNNCSLVNTDKFFQFLNGFLKSEYLFSYKEIENICYALNRICMRVWAEPLSEVQLGLLTTGLIEYKQSLQSTYMDIFNEIDQKLN